jgi:transposase-like protein
MRSSNLTLEAYMTPMEPSRVRDMDEAILHLYYVKNYTLRGIAKWLNERGIRASHNVVYLRIKKAKERLRNKY